jgi:hypothetical protein
MTLHDLFVQGCLLWYKEADLEPGNPEDGVWEDCHYPEPKCLGGKKTVKLLKEHHAVQGVLQSMVYDYPCIRGWEINYLQGDWEWLKPICTHYHRMSGKIGAQKSNIKRPVKVIFPNNDYWIFDSVTEAERELNRKLWSKYYRGPDKMVSKTGHIVEFL